MKYYFKCPKCGYDEGFRRYFEQSSASLPFIFFFGHVSRSLLHDYHQARRVRCDQCGYIFNQPVLPTPGVVRLSIAILFLHIAAALVGIFIIIDPELVKTIPRPEFLQDMLSKNPEEFALLGAATCLATFLICITASVVSVFRQKRRLAEKFLYKPKPRTMRLRRNINKNDAAFRRLNFTEEDLADDEPERDS